MPSIYHAGNLPPTPRGRYILAGRSKDADLLHELAQVSEVWVRKAVAYNEAAAPRTVAMLMQDPDSKTRSAAAKRADADRDLLVGMLSDPDPWMRAAAARHLLLPFATVAPLVDDPDPMVRKAVIYRADCSAEVLTARAEDPDSTVRYGVAKQMASRATQAPTAAVAAILANANAFAARAMTRVRKENGTFPDLPVEALLAGARHQDLFTRWNIADRPDCPPSVLLVLLEDTETETRRRVARHPNATDEVLTVAALDRAGTVRMEVRNRADGGRWLVTHPDPRVRVVATRLISCTAAWFLMLLEDPDPGVRVAAVREGTQPQADTLVADPDPGVRAAVAAKTRSASVLTTLAGDSVWRVRKAVAGNQFVPEPVVSRLAEDPIASVAKAAIERFMTALASRSA